MAFHKVSLAVPTVTPAYNLPDVPTVHQRPRVERLKCPSEQKYQILCKPTLEGVPLARSKMISTHEGRMKDDDDDDDDDWTDISLEDLGLTCVHRA
eukprot:scaffold27151_cov58-Cyclotella_meneghiniana.AAC.1